MILDDMLLCTLDLLLTSYLLQLTFLTAEAKFTSFMTDDVSLVSLAGTLPSVWGSMGGFSSLSVLLVHSTLMTGTLPASWGSNDSFMSLSKLQLGNGIFAGPLPQEWGSQLQTLSTLSIFNCSITGVSLHTAHCSL